MFRFKIEKVSLLFSTQVSRDVIRATPLSSECLKCLADEGWRGGALKVVDIFTENSLMLFRNYGFLAGNQLYFNCYKQSGLAKGIRLRKMPLCPKKPEILICFKEVPLLVMGPCCTNVESFFR